MKKISSFILLTLILFYWNNGQATEEIQIQITGHKARLTYQVLDDGRTGKTYLYEAMVAGIDIIRKMPDFRRLG